MKSVTHKSAQVVREVKGLLAVGKDCTAGRVAALALIGGTASGVQCSDSAVITGAEEILEMLPENTGRRRVFWTGFISVMRCL